MAWYIAIQDHHNPLSQHGIASYVTKFESQSFRLHFKTWGSRTLAIFWEQVSRLLCCAYASYSTENKGLLTEQALLLSKESLFRQQAFGPSCANALVLCLLLH